MGQRQPNLVGAIPTNGQALNSRA
ncbi:uncharacterized protein METZ01_LOCUS160559, partial [marine metagenome]